MSMRINVNLFPRDGYFYVEADGTRLVGQTWSGVVARVRDYRRRNGLPPGDPLNEVHEQACKRNPNLCSAINEATVQARKLVSLKGRMLGWLALMRKNRAKAPLAFVDASEAKRRADICASCPMNAHLKSGCGACKRALAEMRKDLIGGERSPDPRLSGCLVTGEDLAASTWIDQVRVDLPAAPAVCWRKRTL